MSRVLFVNGNVHGHINPTLPLVSELTRRGEDVFYFSTQEFKQKVEEAGAKFIDYGEAFIQFLAHFRPSSNHPFYTLIEFMTKMDRAVIPIVMSKASELNFDYIIHDAMFGGGRILTQKLKCPGICSCTSYAMNKLPVPAYMLEPGFHPQLDFCYQEMQEAAKEWHLDSLSIMDIFFKKEDLNIVFTSKMFQPEADSFDNSYKFVGPSLGERKEKIDFCLETVKDKKVVYISMGTINNGCIDFYKQCIQALKGENLKVIMSLGNKVDVTSLGEIPDNFIVKEYVPQLEVLKRTDVFLSHGGLNSVSEALYYGVPIITVPLTNDQPAVAKQLVKLGAGLKLEIGEITAQVLRDSVRKVLSESNFRQCSEKIGKSFVEAGGYKAAADFILAFIQQSKKKP